MTKKVIKPIKEQPVTQLITIQFVVDVETNVHENVDQALDTLRELGFAVVTKSTLLTNEFEEMCEILRDDEDKHFKY